jgi:hypothetical protein
MVGLEVLSQVDHLFVDGGDFFLDHPLKPISEVFSWERIFITPSK